MASRRIWRTILGVCLAVAAGGSINPAAGNELDDAFAELARLRDQERVLVEAARQPLEAVFAARLRFELAEDPEEARLAAERNRIDAALAEAFNRLSEAGKEEELWGRERAFLQSTYEALTPVADKLTPRQFSLLSEQLASMRSGGTIAADGPGAVDGLAAMRNRIGALTDLIAGARERAKAKRAELSTEIDSLQAERSQVEDDLGKPVQFNETKFGNWLAAAGKLAETELALVDVRTSIDDLVDRIVAILGKEGPAYLSEVKVSFGSAIAYQATWESQDDDSDRARKSRGLREAERNLVDTLGQLSIERGKLQEIRQELAEALSSEAGRVNAAAADWASSKEFGIYMAAGVDAATSVAEFLAGNRAAVVTTKAAELGKFISASVSARIAGRMAARYSANPLLDTTIRLTSSRLARQEAMDAARQVMVTMANQAIDRRTASGMARAQAARLTEEEFRPVLRRFLGLLENGFSLTSLNGELAEAEAGIVRKVLLEARREGLDLEQYLSKDRDWQVAIVEYMAGEYLPGPGAKTAAAVFGDLAESRIGRGSDAGGAIGGTSEIFSGVLIGDAVENALKTAVYGTFGAENASLEALKRFRNLSGGPALFFKNLKEGYSANVAGTLVSLMSTAYKLAVAKYLDDQTEAASARFWDALAASAVHQALYNRLIADDYRLWEIQRPLKVALAAVRVELARLKEDKELKILADNEITDPQERVRMDFRFSTALSLPPQLRFGPTLWELKPVGPLPTQDWMIETPACFLETGRLTLVLNPATDPFPDLDSDPTKPPVKEPGMEEFQQYEPGPDTNHLVKLAFAPKPDALPTEGCWVGSGGIMVVTRSSVTFSIKEPPLYPQDLAVTAGGISMYFPNPHPGGLGGTVKLMLDASGRTMKGELVSDDGKFINPWGYARQPRELPGLVR